METVRGYKVFNPDWTCRGFQYEVGGIYAENITPNVCSEGFHFCKQAVDCFNYYDFNPNNKVAEVVASGDVDEEGDKCSTNRIQILREISWGELLTLVNTGKGNSGNRNSGDSNSGDWNSGNRNSGYWNSGDWNSGHSNSGDWNSGHSNSGHSNSGDWNSGHSNSGYWNSGDWNSGHSNSGDSNSGDSNSGHWNQGDFCTGDFNISDHETGCFCTEEHKIRFFDQETDMTLDQWRNSGAYYLLRRIPFEPTRWIWSKDMTDEEKFAHPEYEVTGGYLKECDTDQAFLVWWDSLNQFERDIIKQIPNFDAEKFEQITGIRVNR